jgi:uncharacterized membrane protein YcaP (DUF421 family)
METPLLEVCLRTLAIYAVLLASFRVLGKREISQFTPFDLVLIMVLANAVQNAMVGSNNSLGAGLAAALVLLGANFLLNRVLRASPKLRHFVEGMPTVLLRHGRVEWRALERENLDLDTLRAALREHGLEEFRQADLAVLELDGSISVVGGQPGALPKRRKRKANPRLRI